jgi:hypothetical protein
MSISLKFKNINSVNGKDPICRIQLNERDIFFGKVQNQIDLEADFKRENKLKIFFENKTGKDTIIDKNNKILKDLSFELEQITIDSLDLQHLKWQSKYHFNDSAIDSCLFFGPKGYWEIIFESPILKWYLKTNHEKNNNDPTWETDYNHYEEACQKLSKIRTK